MKPKSRDSFLMELTEAKDKLDKSGRKVELGDASGEPSGLESDFELPYSSLPKISAERWKQ